MNPSMAATKLMKRLLHNIDLSFKLIRKRESYKWPVYDTLNRYPSQWSKVENPEIKDAKDASSSPKISQEINQTDPNLGVNKYGSDDENATSNKWKLELDWLSKSLEPAVQMWRWRWPIPTGNAQGNKIPPSSRSFAEILASIQRSKLGVQDWSLSDLTIGLYLIYLKQASTNPFEDVKGVKISCDTVVQDLIYHVELAKGAYRDSAAALAKNSMLRESNMTKFVKNSSMLRPGYYIGIDTRNKLVIFGIRGTHTVSDLITDIVSSSDVEVNFEGYTTHFGTAEAARWFLTHFEGYITNTSSTISLFLAWLRLVGHSIGGAVASMLAIMIRKKTREELGFIPEIVTAVGYGTPPCVSKELAESCSDYVINVCMQDDIIPRLSMGTLMRLRNEILKTDWKTIIEKEDWKTVLDLVTNAKQVVSSVQDAARKVVDYTKFGSRTKFIGKLYIA